MDGPAGDLFDALAPTYDRGNRVISLGQDLRWKRRAVAAVQARDGGLYVDVGAGTGDLAKRLLAESPANRVVAIDFSGPMLFAGHFAAGGPIHAMRGDAQNLPLLPGTADGAVTGFLLRNLSDLPAFFGSAFQVLKPGARLVILEIAYPSGLLRRALFKSYFHGVVPLLGGLVTGRRRDYAYLSRSLRTFPSPSRLSDMAAAAGFRKISLRHGQWTGMFVLVLEKPAASHNYGQVVLLDVPYPLAAIRQVRSHPP